MILSYRYIAIWVVIFVIAIAICWWLAGVYEVKNPPPLKPRYDYSYLERQFSEIPQKLWFRNDPCIFDRYLACKCEEYTIIDSNMKVIYNNKQRKKTLDCGKDKCENDVCDYKPCLNVNEIPNTFETIDAIVTGTGRIIRVKTKQGKKCTKTCARCQNLAVRVRDGDIQRVVHISKTVIAPCDVSF